MSVGEYLAAAREAARLSVEDVSRATRIRGVLIREIEADGVELCGGPVYARGHIRAIATHLGVDPVPLLAEFDRAHAGGVRGPGARQIFEREVLAVPNRRGPNWTAAMAVAAAVLLVVAVTSLITTNDPQSGRVAEGVPSTSTASTEPSAPAPVAPAASATPGPDLAFVTPGGVFLRVRVPVPGGKCYVQVREGGPRGPKLFEGTLTTGAVKDFRSTKPLYLLLGNAGAVTLVVNGRDLGSPGRPGQVVRTTFNPGDPAGAAG
ncbi:MAG TPA: helix-turn-helix domain-containing protein [Mycobacteriales bacterium]|nr:helix-turn-helix domain-containing protein [Mycobacteriales bacterium]